MKKHFSKLLTVVLALTMVLTMLNVSFAAAAPVEVSTADDLTAALANGGEIKLTGDITVTDVVFTVTKPTVLDLNTFKISGKATNSSASKLFQVNNELTLKNGTVTFYATTPDTEWGGEGQPPYPGYASNAINCAAKLTVINATVENTTARGGASYAIDCYPGADLFVENGTTINGHNKTAVRMFCNSTTVSTKVTVNGGLITGSRGIWVQLPSGNIASKKMADLTVTGGTITRTLETDYAIYSYSYGDSFENANVTIEGGVFNGDIVFGGGANKTQTENISITGGTFNGEVGRWVTADIFYAFDVPYSSESTTFVKTADELAAAVAEGGVVILANDITISSKLSIAADTVIEGAGHKLTYTGSDRVIDVPNTTNGADLTVNNLTIVCSSGWSDRGINYNTNGTLTLNNVDISGNNMNYVINFPGSSNGATAVITDSTLIGNFPLNIWGSDMTVDVIDSDLCSNRTSETDGKSAIQLNNNGTNIANGTVVNVTGGSVKSYYSDKTTPANAVFDATLTGAVNISESTVVVGECVKPRYVVSIVYPNTNNAYYLTSLQSAVDRVITDGEGSLKLLTDVELSASVTVDAPISLDLAGKTLTGPADAPIFDFASQAIVTITTSGGELVSEIGPMSCAPLGGVVIDGVDVDPNTCHDIEHFAAKPATCTEDGNFEYWHCTVCDRYVLNEEFTQIITKEGTVIGATGHQNIVAIPAVDATCTKDGSTAGEKCADCGTVTKAPQVIAAYHDEYNMRDKAATCTADGYTGGIGCYVCGETIVEPTVIPATGHTPVAVAGKAATCTETGLTEGTKCSVCDATIEAQKVVAKLAHKYADGKCTVCGEAEAAASQPTTSSATSAPTTSETTSAPTTSETASTPASSAPVVPSEPIVTSDGTTVKTDGSYVVADGTVVENDGTIVKTDGTVIKPDEAVAEIEETVVKVENEEEIKEAVPMTQEEETKVAEGAKVEVWVEVKDASATVNEETKKIITDAMEDNRVGMFLDVDMFKQVVTEDEAPSAEKATQLTKLNEKITISFELPKALVAPTTAVVRQYFIVRVHDGVADLIPAKFDEATGKLSFETDRFSNYAVVYTDTVKADLVLPSTGSPAGSTPWMWISVLALVVGAAFVLVARKQRTNA